MKTAGHNCKNTVIVGAHPDDCEIYAGGLACLLRSAGHNVTFISMTSGNAGHHSMTAPALKARRYEETRRVKELLDIEYILMDIDDGCLEPTIKNRQDLIRILRKCSPDLIITHQLNDYHPDHRYTAQLVCDTAYMLNVPLCVPEVPIVGKNIAYCHMCLKPQQDAMTILVPIDTVLDKKILATHQHESQIYEWLPWTEGIDPSTIPADEPGRLAYLERRWVTDWQRKTREFVIYYNDHFHADRPEFVEAFTASPYGHILTPENIASFFPIHKVVVI